MNQRENRPEKNPEAATRLTQATADPTTQRRHDQRDRQRHLWSRRLQLDCGCTDQCRCDYRNNPSDRRVDGYLAAIEHLAEQGLCAAALSPELRALWRRGGSDRRMAETINRRWTA